MSGELIINEFMGHIWINEDYVLSRQNGGWTLINKDGKRVRGQPIDMSLVDGILFADDYLKLTDRQRDEWPANILIMEVMVLARAYVSVRYPDTNPLDLNIMLMTNGIDKAKTALSVIGNRMPDDTDERLVEEVTEAVWRSNIGKSRQGDRWPEDVQGRSEELLRERTRFALRELNDYRVKNSY